MVRFFFVGLTLYVVAQMYGWVSHDSIIKRTVKCKYCRKSISEKVSTLYEALVEEVVLTSGVGAALCELYELAGWEGWLIVGG